MNSTRKNQDMNKQKIKTCADCGNVFRVERIKISQDYNDFGYKYCPFCGTMTDEWADE
jgi:uncharacterized Zn-finger protein